MKKKIKDLTFEERKKICDSFIECDECPLYGDKNIIDFGQCLHDILSNLESLRYDLEEEVEEDE